MPAQYLRMENITKIYEPHHVVANSGVNLDLGQGEIHAIVGENGAGKSTLMKILYGEEQPDSGRIIFQGKEVKITNPFIAKKYRIGMIHQEFKLFPTLTVAQNIVLGEEPRKAGLFYNQRKANNEVERISQQYNLEVRPQQVLNLLSVGQKQRVEILKMLYRGADILILDEPTAVLVKQEVDSLFDVLRRLASLGKTLILITHKISEVKALSNRVSVMRAGKIVKSAATDSLSEANICELMIGKNIDLTIAKREAGCKGPVLEVNNLSIITRDSEKPLLEDVNFSVRSGEIFGIAGVAGNGQAQLVEALFGLRGISCGTIHVNGKSSVYLQPNRLRRMGVGYVPGERATRGTALDGTLWENLISDTLYSFEKYFLLNVKAIEAYCDAQIEKYKIRSNGCHMKAHMLSGGNLQKLVLSREFKQNIKLLIIEEPTRGLDFQSALFVYNRIVDISKQGCAVLIVSSDLNELMQLADRIAVMYKGEITKVFDSAAKPTAYQIGEYMMGLKTKRQEKQ